MSDFVSRVAARAVGRTAVARPRLPALFEPAGPVAGLEVVEETVAPRPHANAQRAPSVAGTPPPPPRDREAPPPVTPPRPAPGRAPHESGVRRDTVVLGDPANGDAAAEREVELVAAERTPVTAAAAPLPAAPPVVAPAAVAAPVARSAPAEPPAAAPPAATGTPHVRVHIGRLEVRANLSEPRPPQRPPERARPQELSLGDYLRGRRSRP